MAAAEDSNFIFTVSLARKSRCSKRGMTGRRKADVLESTPACLGSSPGG